MDLSPAESPTVDFSYEEWIAHHFSLLSHAEDDRMGRPVSPFQVMELERNAARSELKATRLQLQQLQQQANTTIQQLAAQVSQMNMFIGAIAHAMGGKLHVPHASLDALRHDPHRMKENVDAELKVTVIEVMKVDPDEQPAPAEAASDVGEGEPTQEPLIQVVSR